MNTPRFAMRYLLVAILLLLSTAALPAEEDMIYWIDSYPEAIDEAKKTGKPLFLEFRCEP